MIKSTPFNTAATSIEISRIKKNKSSITPDLERWTDLQTLFNAYFFYQIHFREDYLSDFFIGFSSFYMSFKNS